MNLVVRILLALALLAMLAFCIFGFLASYEYPEASQRLPWQLGYGAGGAGCLFATLWLWRFRGPVAHTRHEKPTNDSNRIA